jgi:hypothetical protein
MGSNLSIEKFGDKPMRVIQESNEPLVMSDDEDQPNTLKAITHQDLKIPEGTKPITRTKPIQETRSKLPIYMKEQ